MIVRSRLVITAALVAVGALGTVGCSSPPPARLVALEMIDTLDQPESVRDCMTAKVEAMTELEVEAIAASEDQLTLDGFSADLASCIGG